MRPALVLALLTACRVVPTASRAPTAVSATPPALRASLDAALASAGPREAVLVAAAAGDATAVARLIAAGADGDAAPDPMDEDFAWTPLTAARARNHRAVVDLLERVRTRSRRATSSRAPGPRSTSVASSMPRSRPRCRRRRAWWCSRPSAARFA